MRACVVCGSLDRKPYFDSSVRAPEPYPISGRQTIVRCLACGFVYGDSDNSAAAYEEYYRTLNKHKKRAGDANVLDAAYFEKICGLLGHLGKEVRVLDFGSGDLLMRDVLRKRGLKDIHAYDVGGEANADMGTFDLVITTHTFEHILDADCILERLKEYLKAHGRLLIAVPNLDEYGAGCYYGPYNAFDLEHINHFTKRTLGNFVRRHGFDLLKIMADRREVRPGLFYPEVIALCERNDSDHAAGVCKRGNITGCNESADLGLRRYLARSSADFSEALRKIDELRDRRLVVWGVGIFAMRVAYSRDELNASFVDSDPRLWGRTMLGRPIMSPSELGPMDRDTTIVVAAVNAGDIIGSIKKQVGHDVRIMKL